ncbi:MAG TPA: urease accessory protein [Halieaceae bacterium]|nr:urease accessory protein [Halieaceae bacterium]
MMSVLLLGFVIGMRHALEADHVAAVASLAVRSRSIAQSVREGAAWGFGHTLTLFAVGAFVLLAGTSIPDRLAVVLEALVGVMLIVLGLDVARRLIRDRVHFHTHQHDDGEHHFHAHSHRGELRSGHDPVAHEHTHAKPFPGRALMIGLMHGLAGSGALVVLALATVRSPSLGVLYIVLFGLGSILGMAVLSMVLAVPLRWSGSRLTWLHRSAQVLVSVLNLGLGVMLILPAVDAFA